MVCRSEFGTFKRSVLAIAFLLTTAACDADMPKTKASRPATDDPNYVLGYHNGLDDGRTDICNQIKSYKPALTGELREQGICP